MYLNMSSTNHRKGIDISITLEGHNEPEVLKLFEELLTFLEIKEYTVEERHTCDV